MDADKCERRYIRVYPQEAVSLVCIAKVSFPSCVQGHRIYLPALSSAVSLLYTPVDAADFAPTRLSPGVVRAFSLLCELS